MDKQGNLYFGFSWLLEFFITLKSKKYTDVFLNSHFAVFCLHDTYSQKAQAGYQIVGDEERHN